jgi:hypothetical protein
MRLIRCTVLLTALAWASSLQAQVPAPASVPDAPAIAAGDLRIEWEVTNRFRLFRSEEDFKRHVAAHRGDGVLAAERRLEKASDGRGWARDMLDRLCVDQSGRLLETCQRDGVRESYLAPEDHRIAAVIAGPLPANTGCTWRFNDRQDRPQETTLPCDEEVRLRVRYGRPTLATVDIALTDGTAQQIKTEIGVRDFLIAGLGDSIAAGEGNPDRPIALDEGGFCFRRFLGGAFSEYFRPGRAGFRGNKACDPAPDPGGNSLADWAKLNARWLSSICHRSLYGYQMRAALALAIENPHIAVTFLPLACSGATIASGFLGSQPVRECPTTGSCPGTAPAQIARLREVMALAQRQRADRQLDLVLLTIGANDIWFSSLVGDVIVEGATERALFKRGNLIIDVPQAQRLLDNELIPNFTKLRAALKPFVSGDLSRVVFLSYGHPALDTAGELCGGGRAGFDVHPAFNVDGGRLQRVSEFLTSRFLPKIKSLATCLGQGGCRDPSERMTFVDAHQEAFARHGFCARAEDDPVFDRECFSDKGESFRTNPAEAAIEPLTCGPRAREFRPYASRARWIRTANDSYFTAMTFPEGLNPGLQPSDVHDAIWGATSAVYGGAVHPTAEGYAAMADAALPAMRALLDLPQPPAVDASPLPPVQLKSGE